MDNDQSKNDHAEREYLDQLMTEQQAAKFLCCSVKALQKWRGKVDGPPFVKLFRSVRYRRRELIPWSENLIRQSTSDPRSL